MRKYTDFTNDVIQEIHDYCIDIEQRRIFLHGFSDSDQEDAGTDFRMSNRFLKNLFLLDSTPQYVINIHQQNIGGESSSGMMIYDIIHNASSHINMICHGEVMSMGTVILQAADTRIAMPNCDFMFHFGQGGANDTYLNAQSFAAYHKDFVNKMIKIYAERCHGSIGFKGKSINDIKSFLRTKFASKGDWYLNAEKAKEYGFIDKIIGVDCELKDV